MAKKKQEGEVNKSQAIRELLKAKPNIKASEAMTALAEKNITIKTSLFYIVKGKVAGRKSRRRKNQRTAVGMVTAMSNSEASSRKADAITTIRKIKAVATELGGLGVLKGIVDALSE